MKVLQEYDSKPFEKHILSTENNFTFLGWDGR